MNNTSSPSSTTSPLTSVEDSPLLNLLSTPMHEMSEEELRCHIQNLREVSSNSATLKRQISAKPEKTTSEREPSQSQVDKLASKYSF